MIWVIEGIYYNGRNNNMNKTQLLITIAVMEKSQEFFQKEWLKIELSYDPTILSWVNA